MTWLFFSRKISCCLHMCTNSIFVYGMNYIFYDYGMIKTRVVQVVPLCIHFGPWNWRISRASIRMYTLAKVHPISQTRYGRPKYVNEASFTEYNNPTCPYQ